jgi:histidinol-phosphate aminotransferase
MTTRSPALGARADLHDVEPYVSPQLPARYRLNTNESPYPPPPGFVDQVAEAVRQAALNRYPDRDATALHAALAEHVGWPREGLWIANGSNEVFMHLFLAFGGADRRAMVFEPTYSVHTLIPRIAGTRVTPVDRGPDLRIDLDGALRAIQSTRPDVIIVTSPNNPSGLLEDRASIEALLGAAPGLVVVDEAYIEFAPPGSSIKDMLDRHPNLVVTRTFSKAWRLAGVRLGYLMAAPQIVTEMARVRLPYHLSALTQVMGELVLAHATDTDDVVRKVTAERDRIVDGLRARSFDPTGSASNFVLFTVPDAQQMWAALLERGVLVRNYLGVRGLDDRLRVTAGLPEETDAFFSALDEVLDGRP